MRAVGRAPVGVRTKLLIAFAGIAALLVVVAVLGLRVLGQSNARVETLGTLQLRAATYQSLQTQAQQMRQLLSIRAAQDPNLSVYVGVPASDVVGLWPIAVLVLVLAFLMVSTIRYRTFKDAGLNPRTLIAFVVVIAIGVVIALRGRPSLVLVVYFTCYVALGILEEALFGRRRRAAARAGASALPAEAEVEEPLLPAEEDDDVALEGASAAAAADDGENDS